MAVGRRDFLAGLGAAGAAALAPAFGRRVAAQGAAAARPFRIDTHAHFTVPKLYDLATAHGVQQATLKDWSPAKMLAEMEEGGVATSIISISDPGVHFGDDMAARALARECNDAGAKVVRDYPGRFGLFAVLPLPDVEGSLKELEYALDTLKADGIGVLSSYEGKYLGNAAFTPLLQEMNRRKGVVYCHPYCAACGVQTTLTDAQNRGVEFVFDTTRTILSLLQTGAVAQFPDIRFIWSHGGGTVPYITSRLNGAGGNKLPKGVVYELQKFYYDTAQAFNPYTMPSFRKFVPTSQILFGTDFPLGGGSAAIVAKGLKDNGGFTDAELRAVERENALKLLPRLKT
ncbi:MAG TPA: amidohydrolase family protein [Vicinamibacterales bacterium]|jgi:predicted TIM-barrel fold metal-dependent hydrolase|nr:amidohydrolase family protein [Vicinamibacterales bacterium]